MRVPRATLRKLRAAATVQRLSHAKVLADAIDRYLDALQPDQWTLVEGLLRRATDVFEQPSKRPNTDRASRPITVLNVDDHEAALFARSSILRKEGWNVVEAQTGRGALEAVRRHQPDVVLLDVHLPDINGLEVCRLIKADAETRHIKVVQGLASVRAPLDHLHPLPRRRRRHVPPPTRFPPAPSPPLTDPCSPTAPRRSSPPSLSAPPERTPPTPPRPLACLCLSPPCPAAPPPRDGARPPPPLIFFL